MKLSSIQYEENALRSLKVDINSARLYLAGISNYTIAPRQSKKYCNIQLSSSSMDRLSRTLANIYSELDNLESVINSRLYVIKDYDSFEIVEE